MVRRERRSSGDDVWGKQYRLIITFRSKGTSCGSGPRRHSGHERSVILCPPFHPLQAGAKQPGVLPPGRFVAELAVRESGREAASPWRMLVVRELATIREITEVALGGWRRLMHKLCRISANLSVRIDLVRAGTGRFPASDGRDSSSLRPGVRFAPRRRADTLMDDIF